MNKIYSVSILVLILFGLITTILPVVEIPMVEGARFNPVLAATDCPLVAGAVACENIIEASYSVSIRAGSYVVEKVDGEAPYFTPAHFTLVFRTDTTDHVQFDGLEFYLYMSKDGLSAISPDDIVYAGPFILADLYGSGLKKYEFDYPVLHPANREFYIGTVNIGETSYAVVIGPVPYDIIGDYKYIKIFDGLMTQVAVGGIVEILPSISLEPIGGPGSGRVTLVGAAFEPNALLNLTYLEPARVEGVFAQVLTGPDGKFTYTWDIVDLYEEWTGIGEIPYDTVVIGVYYNLTTLAPPDGFVDQVIYMEYRRAFVEIRSIDFGDTALPFTSIYLGAGSGQVTVNAYVFDTIVVAGAWWNPTMPVNFYVGDTLVATVMPDSTHGFFNITFEVPELGMGIHAVSVTQDHVRYTFNINVHPTLVLEPTEGPVGTIVEAIAYGFPANQSISLFWTGCRDHWNIVNATTGPDGRFNVTVRFTVPVDYGGPHVVSAYYPASSTPTTWITDAIFTITPSVSLPEVVHNDGAEFLVRFYGLDPDQVYSAIVDNQFFNIVVSNACGALNISLIGAGFRPGLHSIGLYGYPGGYPVVYGLFRVLGEGDVIYDALTRIGGDLNTITGHLVAIRDDLAVIKTNTGTIITKLGELEPIIVSINNNVATLVTKIGVIETDVSVIKGLVTAYNATLVAIKSGVDKATSDVAVIKTDVGTIKADVTLLKPVIFRLNDNLITALTSLGEIKTDLKALDALIVDIRNGVARIETALGPLQVSLGDLGAKLVKIDGDIAVVKTNLGEVRALVSALDPKIVEIRNGIAIIDTKLGTIQADVGTVKANTADVPQLIADAPQLIIAIWIAVAFSIISAILAAFTVITIHRKIAG